MYFNAPISSYYPDDGSKYIDPMYRPYINKDLPLIKGDTATSTRCYAPMNTWPKGGACSPPDYHPDTVRVGWNQDYQRIHPQDPCITGFRDTGTNEAMCTRMSSQGHESNFYKEDHFQVQYQYPQGYTVMPDDKKAIGYLNSLQPNPELQVRSINPHTGLYVQYFMPHPNKISNTYGRAPMKNSYLGQP